MNRIVGDLSPTLNDHKKTCPVLDPPVRDSITQIILHSRKSDSPLVKQTIYDVSSSRSKACRERSHVELNQNREHLVNSETFLIIIYVRIPENTFDLDYSLSDAQIIP